MSYNQKLVSEFLEQVRRGVIVRTTKEMVEMLGPDVSYVDTFVANYRLASSLYEEGVWKFASVERTQFMTNSGLALYVSSRWGDSSYTTDLPVYFAPHITRSGVMEDIKKATKDEVITYPIAVASWAFGGVSEMGKWCTNNEIGYVYMASLVVGKAPIIQFSALSARTPPATSPPPPEDHIRVLRVLEYSGSRSAVEEAVAKSVTGEKRWGDRPVLLKAATIGTYPEILTSPIPDHSTYFHVGDRVVLANDEDKWVYEVRDVNCPNKIGVIAMMNLGVPGITPSYVDFNQVRRWEPPTPNSKTVCETIADNRSAAPTPTPPKRRRMITYKCYVCGLGDTFVSPSSATLLDILEAATDHHKRRLEAYRVDCWVGIIGEHRTIYA